MTCVEKNFTISYLCVPFYLAISSHRTELYEEKGKCKKKTKQKTINTYNQGFIQAQTDLPLPEVKTQS